jgi:hypothetical protein
LLNRSGSEPALQEQEHHQEDQHDRFQQSLHHFFDRLRDEGRGVIRKVDADARWERRLKIGDLLAHARGGIDGVGAGGETHGHAGRWLAAETAFESIACRAELHARDIAQAHGCAIGQGAQQNVLELLRRLQQ